MMIDVGSVAPDFQLHGLNGREFSLDAELAIHPVVLVFFKVSCPTCQFTLPFLDRLHGQVRTATMLQIYGVSQDNATATEEFARYFHLSFPMLIDPAENGYRVSNLYRITNVPSFFLVEPGGKIVWSLNGFHKAELEALGSRFGQSPFIAGERVPAMRPG